MTAQLTRPLPSPSHVPPDTVDPVASANSPCVVEAGAPHPLGATVGRRTASTSPSSPSTPTRVELLLFDEHDAVEPFQTITLDPPLHRTFHFWHCYVRGLQAGHALRLPRRRAVGPPRARPPLQPEQGADRPVRQGDHDDALGRGAACGPDDNLATSMRGVVIDLADYDWEGDQPLNRPMSETIIYEMHVGGLHQVADLGRRATRARSPASSRRSRTCKSLGVTAVELLPVFQFDPTARSRSRARSTGAMLTNYWGYSTVGVLRAARGLLHLARS